MIEFSRFELDNGLKVLVHEDTSTPMVVVNILYNVGARDELPEKTGFAHLVEHLMFGGSANIPDFDEPIQLAGGENNAFTNNDLTNFYDILPSENLEIAFWLESDRMFSLNFEENALEIQRKVVLEEFKETCLNQPYGDAWHHIADLAYKVHPYRWPTIGKIPKHLEEATLDDARNFHQKYYRPNNAILVVSGNASIKKVKHLAEKWFGDIPSGKIQERRLPQEPPQQKLQQRINRAKVPVDALYLAFHAPARRHRDYYTVDLISDVLCNGRSSRLYRRLLKEKQLFTSIDCFITGNIDPGLLIIEGKPSEGTSLQDAELAIWEILEEMKVEKISDYELQKVKNKMESNLVFSECNILNKAINLAFFELMGDASIINKEKNYYRQIAAEDIQRQAKQLFTEENCSKLYYKTSDK
ncbi:MAG: insulinase family protein [Bacteroidetes bacterium]|nr:insulinase family protein [Bacteroidota bacterium]